MVAPQTPALHFSKVVAVPLSWSLSVASKYWVAWWLEHRTPDRKAWIRCSMPPNTLRVHTEYVRVKISGSESLVG
ncbi:hypothetical protein TNCV_2143611 [Trichonephila clavipes]|nr:hypothetical protein TNCV_2143611 [Trichonephila clavipes]